MRKNERMGLYILLAAMIVITLILGMLLHYQQNTNLSQIRSQGASIARLLSAMTLAQLAPDRVGREVLQIIRSKYLTNFIAPKTKTFARRPDTVWG
jgi:hypothetical protein